MDDRVALDSLFLLSTPRLDIVADCRHLSDLSGEKPVGEERKRRVERVKWTRIAAKRDRRVLGFDRDTSPVMYPNRVCSRL